MASAAARGARRTHLVLLIWCVVWCIKSSIKQGKRTAMASRGAGACAIASPARGPEAAVFGGQAPRAPIQKRHTKQIYIGKR